MVNLTNQIVKRLSDLGYDASNNSIRSATAYFVKKNLTDILGKDSYNDDEVEIMMSARSLSIEPNDFERFNVSVQDGKLVAISDRLLFSITTYGDKVINDRIEGNVDYRSVASEDECALMKYNDSNLEYDVRAKNIGAVKTGKQLYLLQQKYPSEQNTSFLYKLQTLLSNKDYISVSEDIYADARDNYDDIFNKLKEKYSDVLSEDNNKVR